MKGKLRFLTKRFGISAPGDLQSWLADHGIHSLKLKLDETTFVPKANDLIVNWGNATVPSFWNSCTYKILNRPERIKVSTNRLKSLPIMKEAGVNVPKFTTSFETAKGWLVDGHTVVRRQYNKSFQGHGITIHAPGGAPLHSGAALYTLYVPKRREYRVHVFRGVAIDVVQKRKRKGFVSTNKDLESQVRSHDNGWVFCRHGVEVVPDLVEQSVRAVTSLGLDFGAVDAGWTESNGKITVYEVNTAPGIDGTTITKYAEAIKDYYEALGN